MGAPVALWARSGPEACTRPVRPRVAWALRWEGEGGGAPADEVWKAERAGTRPEGTQDPHLCPPPRKFAAENSGTPHPPALPHCPPGEDANLEYLLTVFMGCAFRLVGIIFGTVVSCDASHINFLVLGLTCCSELWLGPPFDIPPRPLSDSLPVLTSAGLLEWGMLSLGGPENLIASSGS